MEELKIKSMKALKLYMKVLKKIPSEKEWNSYARTEKLLSSKSLGYLYGKKFNIMCRAVKRKQNK